MAMLRVSNCPSQDLALTNCAFVNAADAKFVPHAEIGDVVLFVKPHPDVEPGALALNGVQRKLLRVSTGDTIRAEPFAVPSSQFTAAGMTLELEFTKLRTAAELNAVGRHEEVREIRPPIRPSCSSRRFEIRWRRLQGRDGRRRRRRRRRPPRALRT
jgi:vesicle-fusing ATPase